jgi:NTP pyrophosphatase (non-canonical NTP hydrolase)
MQLIELQRQLVTKSKEWFPHIWAKPIEERIPYFLLALSGEVGEAANLGKKYVRSNYDPTYLSELPEELADIFTYLALLIDTLDVDLETEVINKMYYNESRFGKK